jgi:hypothetical protein
VSGGVVIRLGTGRPPFLCQRAAMDTCWVYCFCCGIIEGMDGGDSLKMVFSVRFVDVRCG